MPCIIYAELESLIEKLEYKRKYFLQIFNVNYMEI